MITKVEQQKYVEQEIRDELETLQKQLADYQEVAQGKIAKMVTRKDALSEAIAEHQGEESELLEEVVKIEQNLELYESMVADPAAFIAGIEEQIAEEGTEMPEKASAKRDALLTKAWEPRHLSR